MAAGVFLGGGGLAQMKMFSCLAVNFWHLGGLPLMDSSPRRAYRHNVIWLEYSILPLDDYICSEWFGLRESRLQFRRLDLTSFDIFFQPCNSMIFQLCVLPVPPFALRITAPRPRILALEHNESHAATFIILYRNSTCITIWKTPFLFGN